MKMTALLWRVVSVWLCVALLSGCPRCYVGCTESDQEAQRPHSPQDVRTEEESGERTPHHEVERSPVSPASSLPEIKEPLLEDNQQNEQTTQHLDKEELEAEASDVTAPTVEAEVEADKEYSQWEPEAEPSVENPNLVSDVVQEHDSAAQLSLSDNSSAAELKDEPIVLQDDGPISISEDASDVTEPEVLESNLPPVDCEDDEEEEEEDNPYDNKSSPPVVLENTSNAHSAGTITHIDPPLAPSVAESDQHLETEQDPSSPVTTDTDSSASGKDSGDIPTFDEWTRKMMEVENEKTQSTHSSNNGGSNVQKKAQKNFNNYASVECGAKILGANPEAKSTSAILKENMDLYMLNPCSNKIWFIIELCEPIQVKQLDIANFELFSSTPKDFLVSISDRYPTNKWLKLGTFHARDERTVQSFPLDEHLYAKYVKMFTKYIKVELASHFGSEHFCPLSLIRVFGTSMVEEYEEIADPSERLDDQDDELDYPAGYAPGEVKSSKNLIGSAKDVILTMVNNIAVNVLGGGPEKEANLTSQDVNMTEPSAQIETTVETADVNLTSVPESEEGVVLPDPALPETETPSSVTSESQTQPDSETIEQELPPVEENIVTPLEEDGEEHISSTITVLDGEEELDEDAEWMYGREQQCNCGPPPSLSSSCCCAATLQEYLLRQCSALLSKKRKCQTMGKRQRIPATTPTWQLTPSPSICPEPQVRPTEAHELPRSEHTSEHEPESAAASPSEAQQPWENTMESHKEPVSEPHVLEPSQTSSLPRAGATDSSGATTPIVETPPLPPVETAVEQTPESSQHVSPAAEKKSEPSSSLTSSIYVKPSVGAPAEHASVEPIEEMSDVDASQVEVSVSLEIPERTDQPQPLVPTASVHVDSDPPAAPKTSTPSPELPHPAPDSVAEPEPSADLHLVTETKMADLTEDLSASSASNGHQLHPATPPSLSSPSHSDIYAEATNGTEQNGNQVHGSSSKESVFMRLNNRIKALEMNMSLSGRYLEQLSQRYRKQMEEMQKAFNKTIIKLQNTSKMAEEQDLRQTESIQLLQGQLENVTQLVLNLSDRVSELQNEVSDRQSYLLLSLALCACLGLLLCANHRRFTSRPIADPDSPIPISDTYCWPERQFSEYEDTGLKRSASYPLINSESFQLSNTEGHELQLGEGTQGLSQANRKRRRRKVKPVEKVETLTPSVNAASELSNGAVQCNGAPSASIPAPFAHRFIQPLFRYSQSEGSSEASSSHSDDPSFCGISAACSRICDGLPQPKTRAEKRALRRRRPKPACAVVNMLQVPKRDDREPTVSTIEGLMKEQAERSSGAFGVNATLSGPV